MLFQRIEQQMGIDKADFLLGHLERGARGVVDAADGEGDGNASAKVEELQASLEDAVLKNQQWEAAYQALEAEKAALESERGEREAKLTKVQKHRIDSPENAGPLLELACSIFGRVGQVSASRRRV